METVLRTILREEKEEEVSSRLPASDYETLVVVSQFYSNVDVY